MDEFVEKLVRSDYVCRKNMFWETILFKKLDELQSGVVEFKKYPLILRMRAGVTEKVDISYFDDLEYLIKNYPVIAAGGAVFKSIYGLFQSSDVDIYFYGNYTAAQADVYLTEIMYYFENKYMNIKKVKFERNEGVTNIIVNGKKYQFIHRIYPSKISVVGGFDLQCSSVYYDGTSYGTTPLGAWCIANRVNIFLHTRRSASYIQRMYKYFTNYDCSILLMNTTIEKLKNKSDVNYVYNFDIHNFIGRFVIRVMYNKMDDEISGYGSGVQTEICANAKYAASGNLHLIMWGGDTVDSIINPKIEYEINDKIIKCYTFAEVQSIEDAMPLLRCVMKNSDQEKKFIAKYWLQDKYTELREQIFAYYFYDMNNTYLEKMYNTYTNYILDKVAEGINKVQLKAKTVNWIDKNPMAQSYCVPTNPLIYFNQDIYTEFAITISEPVETLLRLFVKHKIGPFTHLNRNTLNIIIKHYIFSL